MSLSKLLEHIAQKAQQQADQIGAEAAQKAQQIQHQSEAAGKAEAAEIEANAKEKCASLSRRAEAAMNAASRASNEKMRARMMNKVFTSALQQLGKIEGEQRREALRVLVSRIPAGFAGTLHPSTVDAAALPALLQEAGRSADIQMGEAVQSVGGFRLASDTREIDMSFEEIMANTLRPLTQERVRAELFGTNR